MDKRSGTVRSQADRPLDQLIREQDAPQFTLGISLKEKHANAVAAGGRGWHLLDSPVWTITMSVPEVSGDRTTASSASFGEAWQLQNLWWRSPPTTHRPPAGPDYRQVMSADSIERAESQFLGIVRGEAGGEITITVSTTASHWIVNLRVPGMAGEGSTGDGASFAYAWLHDWPWWQDMPRGPAH